MAKNKYILTLENFGAITLSYPPHKQMGAMQDTPGNIVNYGGTSRAPQHWAGGSHVGGFNYHSGHFLGGNVWAGSSPREVGQGKKDLMDFVEFIETTSKFTTDGFRN